MAFKKLLVVIPHSGIVIPNEISLDSLSEDFPRLLRNVDWCTNWLYDFRDILGNSHMVFPYCSLILEGNRHPRILGDSVPLKDIYDEPIYHPGLEPDEALRESLSRKYLDAFHQAIQDEIVRGKVFMLDGHSTVTARGVKDNQIELMNFQFSALDEGPRHYCPEVYLETYAKALQKRLPEVNVTVNSSEYFKVYGHVCAEHSVNAVSRVGSKVPAICQETNEKLYRNPDRSPNVKALNRLRRAFAESLSEMIRKVPRERIKA